MKKIVYVGTTENSKQVLEGILKNGSYIVAVFALDDTLKDEVSGFADYELLKQEHNFSLEKIKDINSKEGVQKIKMYEPDLIYVMAWPQLLKKNILEIPKFGVIGRHLSLLPERRGRAPISWALIDGLKDSGVSLFWMDEGADTGDIIAQEKFFISENDYPPQIFEKTTRITIKMLTDLYPLFNKNIFPRIPQNHSKATYKHKRTPDMGLIDWEKSAERIYNFIRGTSHPFPGAFTYLKLDKIKIWYSQIIEKAGIFGKDGEILSINNDFFIIQTGEGTIKVNIYDVESENKIIIIDKEQKIKLEKDNIKYIQLKKGDIFG